MNNSIKGNQGKACLRKVLNHNAFNTTSSPVFYAAIFVMSHNALTQIKSHAETTCLPSPFSSNIVTPLAD